MPDYTRIQFRKGNNTDWAAADPTLALGEPAIETSAPNTLRLKIGNGTSLYSALPYFDSSTIIIGTLTAVYLTSTQVDNIYAKKASPTLTGTPIVNGTLVAYNFVATSTAKIDNSFVVGSTLTVNNAIVNTTASSANLDVSDLAGINNATSGGTFTLNTVNAANLVVPGIAAIQNATSGGTFTLTTVNATSLVIPGTAAIQNATSGGTFTLTTVNVTNLAVTTVTSGGISTLATVSAVWANISNTLVVQTVTSGGVTTLGTLSSTWANINSAVISGETSSSAFTVSTLGSITYAASITLSMLPAYQTITLTGNLAIAGTSSIALGRTTTLRVLPGASNRTLSFPAGWAFLGFKPTSIAANKTGVLTLTAFGATEADCIAAWAVQV